MTLALDRPDTKTLTSSDSIALEDRYGAHNYHPLNVVIHRAQGVWMWDLEGRRYLDCLSAYSAVNQGHSHPRIVAAMVEQLSRVALTSRAFRNDQLGLFCRDLSQLTGFARVLPMNTGAEAVETAIKAARRWAYTVKGVPDGEAEILVFSGNFHGRTTTVVGFSSEEQYRRGFGPFAPGFRLLPYGDVAAVEAAIGPRTAAVLVEPIQGEGGIILPPAGYLRDLRALCDRHGVLLVLDEIQTGLGRTGKLFAFEHEGVRADGMIVGKALAGGLYPVSAFLADDPLMGVFAPGDHGSTFGGNPLGTAVARVALDVLLSEGMVENSATLGAYALGRLAALGSPHVKEVRGRGLFIGIELHPEAGGARRFCEALERDGVLCKETHHHVLRLAPPLSIRRDELDWGLDRIERVLSAD